MQCAAAAQIAWRAGAGSAWSRLLAPRLMELDSVNQGRAHRVWTDRPVADRHLSRTDRRSQSQKVYRSGSPPPSPVTMSCDPLPVIDLRQAAGPGRAQLASRLVAALETDGFFYVEGIDGYDEHELMSYTRW